VEVEVACSVEATSTKDILEARVEVLLCNGSWIRVLALERWSRKF
jgi:hypothetical protein